MTDSLSTPDSLDALLIERKALHGDFSDHARIAQAFKEVMWTEREAWARLTPEQKEGLEMIFHKAARILAGDPNHPDHWFDIEGYARITRQRLPTGVRKIASTFAPNLKAGGVTRGDAVIVTEKGKTP